MRTRHVLLMLSAALALVANGWRALKAQSAESVSTAISIAELRDHMSVLASDAMNGRLIGTAEFDRSAQYVADSFRNSGLEPANPEFMQRFDVLRGTVDERRTTLTLTLNGTVHRLQYDRDFVTYGSTSGDVLTAGGRVVFAGYAITTPSGFDDFRGLDSANRIVIADLGRPAAISDGDMQRHGSFTERISNVVQHGAAGLIFVDDADIPWSLRVRAAHQVGTVTLLSERGPALPVIILKRTALPELTDPGAITSEVAGAIRLQMHAHIARTENVWGVLRANGAHRDEHVLLVAHLDHVGRGRPMDGDAIYNGAVDNASGVAALLTIAKALSARRAELNRSVVFLASAGEEQGELGSRLFLARGMIPADQISAAINMDGGSIVPFTRLDVGASLDRDLRCAALAAAERIGIELQLSALPSDGSDHAPFLKASIPTLWIQPALPDDWMASRYHTPKDDLQQPIDYAALSRFATLNYLVAETLSKRQEPADVNCRSR